MTAPLTSLPLYLSGLSSTLTIFLFLPASPPPSLVAFCECNFQTPFFFYPGREMRFSKKSSAATASCAAVILMYMYAILA